MDVNILKSLCLMDSSVCGPRNDDPANVLNGSGNLPDKVKGCLLTRRKGELWLVRFPNSLGCELGERRACTRGIFLPWQIVAKIFIESGE